MIRHGSNYFEGKIDSSVLNALILNQLLIFNQYFDHNIAGVYTGFKYTTFTVDWQSNPEVPFVKENICDERTR